MAPDSLEPVLRAVEPAARLVCERHLRKVLHHLADRGREVAPNPALPHRIARDDLVEADVLPPEVLAGDESPLLLLTNPTDRLITGLPRGEQLRVYWRLLFRAAVGAAIDRKLAGGSLTPEDCHQRLKAFGPAAEREIGYVLETEHEIDPQAYTTTRYRAFAAAYLDLHRFAPAAAEEYFPSLPTPAMVERVIGADVDADALFTRTRPAGAADPEPYPPPDQRWSEPDRAMATPLPPAEEQSRLLVRANAAEERGNFVRAAVLRTQAAGATDGDDRDRAVTAARTALGKLVDRIGDVRNWDHETRQEWRQALAPLLEAAAHGIWPRAARCLYELQKIPGDLSREVYAADLVEWMRTLGRRPVKRPLVHAPPVLLMMHLRKAHKQLLRSDIGEQARLRLDRLVNHEIHDTEHTIRHTLTPVITAALTDAGFQPATRVEEVARDKLVAELLDKVCEAGYLRIGDVRDAIARNQLKMPDLSGPGQLVAGDALLKADTNLTYALDGIYRRGEFYLRGLQRGSSLFFGTPPGRLVFLYLVLPFVGAFMTVVAAQEMAHIGGSIAGFVSKILAPKPTKMVATASGPTPAPDDLVTADEVDFDPETGEVVWLDQDEVGNLATQVFTSSASAKPKDGKHSELHIPWPVVIGLGLFYLPLLHVPPFRRAVAGGLRVLWSGVRLVLWDFPRGLWQSPQVKAVRQSRLARFADKYLGAAGLVTFAVVVGMAALGATPWRVFKWGGIVFAGAVIAANTRWGWMVQERLGETVSDWWRVVRVNLIPGLIAAILDFFRRVANWVEQRLYAVDEWLRFRGGDSQGSFALKAALGLLWFPVAYVVRFVFYLLFEPQVNPVKHFPVVTVSHKVIFPMYPSLAELLNISDKTAIGIIFCIPGIFGFIAWELMANWRLYRANRPERLKPATIGSHGETMRGLLRPGFHSGTVPKLYRKMRHACRDGHPEQAARHHHDLHHAAEAVHRFVERELVPLLEGHPDWGKVPVTVGDIHFGCQRAGFDLHAPALGREPVAVSFENRHGTVEATIDRTGWFDKLTAKQRAVLVNALRGLFDMAAADRFDGCDRGCEANGEGKPTPADLARAVTWDEWVAGWVKKPG